MVAQYILWWSCVGRIFLHYLLIIISLIFFLKSFRSHTLEFESLSFYYSYLIIFSISVLYDKDIFTILVFFWYVIIIFWINNVTCLLDCLMSAVVQWLQYYTCEIQSFFKPFPLLIIFSEYLWVITFTNKTWISNFKFSVLFR